MVGNGRATGLCVLAYNEVQFVYNSPFIIISAYRENANFLIPSQWIRFTDNDWAYFFQSDNSKYIPLLNERVQVIREASKVLNTVFRLINHNMNNAHRLLMVP